MTTAPLVIVARLAVPADRKYILASWAEAYKAAPKMRDMSWTLYKLHIVPTLQAVLDRPDTRLLVATTPSEPDIVGWLAYVRGKRVSTVHWVHTRYAVTKGGEKLRKRGVMSALIGAAELGPRWVYTHRGPYPRQREGKRETADAGLVRSLAKRGITAAFVPWKEWV